MNLQGRGLTKVEKHCYRRCKEINRDIVTKIFWNSCNVRGRKSVRHKVTNYVFCLVEHGIERHWRSMPASCVL